MNMILIAVIAIVVLYLYKSSKKEGYGSTVAPDFCQMFIRKIGMPSKGLYNGQPGQIGFQQCINSGMSVGEYQKGLNCVKKSKNLNDYIGCFYA